MKKAKAVVPAAAAASLKSLLDQQERHSVDVLLQAHPDNAGRILFGSKEAQPGVLIPGATANLEKISLDTTYVSGNAADILAILVLR